MGKIRHKLCTHSPSLEARKVSKQIGDWIAEGIEEGIKNPLFWFDEKGNLCKREITPQEKKENNNELS